MIKVEPFKAKLVRNPDMRETKRGPVCNLRVRQIDPGKPSVFIDIAAFGDELAKKCAKLANGTEIDVAAAGLIYNEWEVPAKTKSGKSQRRSKHALLAESITAAS